MQPEDFAHAFGVPRETMEKLEAYHALLLKWQKAINLVSPSTLDEAWERHFADSAQLAQYIPDHIKTIADLGSGAGFPGLVLAIMRPDLDVHMVESDERKAQFLRTVSRETAVGCAVHNMRIEQAYDAIKPDIITARALASLTDLCGYVLPWAEDSSELEMLFLKGENAAPEIEAAQVKFTFDCEQYPSQTAERSTLLHIKNLRIS